jgi:hypothetical protein
MEWFSWYFSDLKTNPIELGSKKKSFEVETQLWGPIYADEEKPFDTKSVEKCQNCKEGTLHSPFSN